MFDFLPILGGQKVVVSDSTEGWCYCSYLYNYYNYSRNNTLNVLKFPFFAGIGSGSRPKDRVTFWITLVHRKQKGDQNWVLSLKAVTALQPLKDDHPGIL